ncbi:MAG: tetratricopeptide repeat protein [Terracidiphilus sp.]
MTLLVNDEYRFENVEISASQCQLYKDGAERHLRKQAFQVLLYLVQQHERAVGREELIRIVWQGSAVTDDSLGQCISEIREALGDSSRHPRYIKTLPKIGYQFIGAVNDRVMNGPAEPEPGLLERQSYSPEGASTVAPVVLTPVVSTLPKRRFVLPVSLALSAVLLVTLAIVAGLRRNRASGSQAVSATRVLPAPRRSIAVLGFKNLSGHPEDAWLSTAFSDWLSAELTAGEQLREIPAEEVAQTRVELALPEGESLSHESLTRIRGNLGTDFVVIGSYARFGNKPDGELLVDVRLQDTASGETLATISEEGTEAHLLELVSRAGENLRAKLNVEQATPDQAAEVAVSLPSNPGAARLYAEGLSRLRAFDALGARDLLQQAIAVEPADALPHSALATALSRLGYDAAAAAEAKRAMELSSRLPRAQRSLVQARYFEVSHNWPQAIEIYRLLFDFFPDRVDYGLALARAQISGGKGKDAEETIATLRKLPPYLSNDPSIDLAEANAADSLGDLKGALGLADQAAQKARSLGASLALAHALTLRADELRNLDRLDEAAAALKEATQIFAAVGDNDEFANAQAISAHLLDLHQDFDGAKKTYEEALSTFRKIGDRDGVERELNNIAVELQQLGDLKGSLKNFEESLAICSELQNQESVAFEKANIGEILLELGDLKGAEQSYRQSLDISQATNNTDMTAHDLQGLGRDLQAQGRLEEAQQDENKAITVFAESGQTQVIDAYSSLSGVLLDMGKYEDAATAARMAIDRMTKLKSPDRYRTDAEAALARVLLAEGKYSDARKVMQQTTRIAGQRMSRESEFIWTITDARVRAASVDHEDKVEAARNLQLVIAETRKAEFVVYELEARLALAQTGIALGDTQTGRADLSALMKEASERGFELVSQKAVAILQTRPSEK